MKIFCIGDVVGKAGCQMLTDSLKGLIQEYGIDFTIVNGENAAGGVGLTPRIAEQIFRAGADLITLGDHTWDRQELVPYLEEEENIIRPANFPEGTPGHGWRILKTGSGTRIGVINLLGRTFMRYNVDCPFRALNKAVDQIRGETPVIIVDFHAETTSEKVALGHFSDGKVSAIVGTHTHIQTADEKILPQGTAYITDLGMTGPYDSVIGQNKHKIIERFFTSRPVRFEVAQDDPCLHGAVIEVDPQTGKASGIFRVQRRPK